MPWAPDDASKHNKNLSKRGKRQWAKVANKVLTESGDEGKAIRIASGALKRRLHK